MFSFERQRYRQMWSDRVSLQEPDLCQKGFQHSCYFCVITLKAVTSAHITFPFQHKVVGKREHTPRQLHTHMYPVGTICLPFPEGCERRVKTWEPRGEGLPLMSSAFAEDAPVSCAQPHWRLATHKAGTQGRGPLLYLHQSHLFPFPFPFPAIRRQ